MSLNGTGMYNDRTDLPSLVVRAVAAARELGFGLCVHPETGALLRVLAGGVPSGGLVGETGTGTGAGLAWMVSNASPHTRFVSVEINPERAAAAAEVFRDHRNVTVLCGDAGELFEQAPFDLLVHDGGWGSGKQDDRRVDPRVVLTEGGLMTIDDFSPMSVWPPFYEGRIDESRLHWLQHPDFLSTEVRVAEGMAVLVCRRTTR